MRRHRKALATAAIGAVVALLAACSSSSGGAQGGGDSASSGAGARAFPVSVKSALGTTTVTSEPQRVVTLGWGSNDAALALGVVPVGMSIQVETARGGITPWARAKLQGKKPVTFSDAGSTLPYEKIAALKPDLILAVYSGLTPEQYSTLSHIAPTVGYPGKAWSTTWQDQLSMVGKALGRSTQAAALQSNIETQVAAAAKAHPEFRGKTAIFGSGTKAGSYNFYPRNDPRMEFLGQLGFTLSDAATKTFTRGAGSPSFATTISLEQISKLQTDLLVAWYLSPSTQKAIEDEPVFQRLGPVAGGAYVPITDQDLLFATSAPNALTIPWMLKSYLPLLSAAAKKAA